MKKTMILFAMAILLLSCKKDKVEVDNPNVSVTFWSTLYDAGNYIPLDSTQFKVYVYKSAYDTTLFQTGYTGKDGKFTSTLLKGKSYLVVATSRSYKFSYDAGPHYYHGKVVDQSNSSSILDPAKYEKVNTANNQVLSCSFSPAYGYGCTDYYIADPTE